MLFVCFGLAWLGLVQLRAPLHTVVFVCSVVRSSCRHSVMHHCNRVVDADVDADVLTRLQDCFCRFGDAINLLLS